MADALEESREVERLPLQREAESVDDFRDRRVADRFDVVGVDHAVAVEVEVLDVARFDVAERLLRPCVDVGLIAEQAGRYEAERLVACLPRAVHVEVFVVGLILIDDHVAGVGEVTAYGQMQVLADRLVVFQRSVDAAVAHLADVHPRLGAQTDVDGDRLPLEKDALAFLFEIVGRDFQLAEQRQVDAHVEFVRLFPAHVGVGPVAHLDRRGAVRSGSEIVAAAGVDRAVVDEAAHVVARADLVVAHNTVGGLDFE